LAGIYIHIPFCRQACSYCNFHFSVSQKNKPALLAALEKEIMLSRDFIETENIETIYIGGGTPSLLSAEELEHLLITLKERFTVSPKAEITLEANPDDINKSILDAWKRLGINRLSVGLQSFNEAELKWMNRAHNAAQSLLCLDEIRDAGFSNFSVDLIYGSPLQNNEDLVRNFEIIAKRNVPHISCYALTVEPKTALNKLIEAHKSPAVDPDRQAEQFSLLLSLMEKAGYEQYEISNFSKPGYRSRHNSSYWQGKPYFGFGPSAHSFDGKGKRRWNVANNNLYIQSLEKGIIPFEEESLTADQKLNEYVMTALRTVEGINLNRLKQDFDPAHTDRILEEAKKYIEGKKLIVNGNFLQLTKEGKFLADGIASDLFA
jgi:oxygen-independent coproporphyrinogen-3 oxidase